MVDNGYSTTFRLPFVHKYSRTEREQFLEGFDYNVKSYMKGDIVFRQGEVCRFLYILLEGEVEAEMTDDSGRCCELRRFGLPGL